MDTNTDNLPAVPVWTSYKPRRVEQRQPGSNVIWIWISPLVDRSKAGRVTQPAVILPFKKGE